MRFCSDPDYIKLMEAVGTDIVELTGDHFQDWGADAMRLTLNMYDERGWLYYGGGANIEGASPGGHAEPQWQPSGLYRLQRQGWLLRPGGRRTAPARSACGYDWMANEIARLRSEGYLPIATYQHFEYYTYPPQGNQRSDFRRMAEAGAVVVSGSQAHQPQAFEFAR